MEQKQNSILLHEPKTEEAVRREFAQFPAAYGRFVSMEQDWQRRLLDYCMGKKTLPLTYDPFFKRIFHPDLHPGRLSRLLSSLLDQELQVVRVLPTEEVLLDGSALLVMDILVELKDGALANVEIQKVPYRFPGERMSCYSSDLVLRQYSRVKGEKGRRFRYGDMHKVYTVVIFEKSPGEIRQRGKGCVHRGRTVFDTGIDLCLLQEYCLVSLDEFKKNRYAEEKNERTGWLTLLTSEEAWEVEEALGEYPWLCEIYQDMGEYLHKPEEVLNMFSEALRILDENTVQYMIEEQQKELEENRKYLEEQQKELEEKDRKLREQQKEIQQLKELLKEKSNPQDQSRQVCQEEK